MVITFFISLVVPLDPLAAIAGPQAAPEETVERLRTLYGFDQPVYVQFGRYLYRLAARRFGNVSFQTGRPVLEDILHFFPATLELATLALAISILVGIPSGRNVRRVSKFATWITFSTGTQPYRGVHAGFLDSDSS